MLSPELELYFAVESEVSATLRELCDPATETILTDVEVYEWYMRQGCELSSKRLYAATTSSATAVCFRGEVGHYSYAVLLDQFKQQHTDELFVEIHRATFEDQLVFVIPQLTLGIIRYALMQCDGVVTKEFVFNWVVGILAHERRHAVQSITLMDVDHLRPIDRTDTLEYLAQPHEFDAFCFNAAVQLGYASMASVHTWSPTEEQKLEMQQRLVQSTAQVNEFQTLCNNMRKTA